ncbi:MAG: adenylate/guanylate cyclase domain-containing protein [Rhodocyclaceae bacterium]|nr:adenylate/guanylate cyclase domain-containing protein [Rhodocyclaceae bacterium]
MSVRKASRKLYVAFWAALLTAGALLQAAGAFAPFDNRLLDTQFRQLRAHWPRAAPVEVALVGIDEATFEAFPEPLALWHGYLGEIAAGLARSQPRAVGIDVQLPSRSYDFVRAGADRQLIEGLRALREAAPLVVARTVDARGAVKPLHGAILALLGEGAGGLVYFPLDADGVVRRFDERLGAGPEQVPTFPGQMVRALGGEARPGWIDFSLGARYRYIPAQQVWRWSRDGNLDELRRAFAGRIVLLGSVLPFDDTHLQPVSLAGWEGAEGLRAPGLLLQAQALRTLLGAGTIQAAPWPATLLLLAIASCAWFAFRRIASGLAWLLLGAAAAWAAALWLLHGGTHLPLGGALIVALAGGAVRTGREAWFERRERARLTRAFNGYVSPNVMGLILSGELATQTGSGYRDLCVMFADVRDFTPLSERIEADRVVAMLNRYFERMTRAIHARDGTVDNFRGDGIMSFFGAPRPSPHPCRDGFLAAQGMLAELEALNRELVAEGLPPIAIGISLAFGRAVVGHVGAAARHEYTAIGDVANVSARIEGLTKEVGYPLLVGAEVAAALGDEARFDDLGEWALKGHSPVRVFGWPPRQG